MDLLLQHTLTLGARIARPGEFSERAFLNEKFDLTQAEAIADLIESHTEQAARCALRSLQGEFSTQVNSLVDRLIDLRSYVEAALDFSEEEIDFLGIDMMSSRLNELQHKINTLLQKAYQGSLLREGMSLVITGRPNAGKSSILNRLAEQDVAIVSAIPGTTRDVLQREIQLAGMPVRVSDTAGLRPSSEPIEQEGIRRAWQEINGADLIVLVVDAQHGYGEQERRIETALPEKVPLLRVWNKMDLLSDYPELSDGAVYVSAKTGKGLEILKQRLLAKVDYQETTEGVFMARRRHLTALRQTSVALEAATRHLYGPCAMELVAEELSNAQRNLGEITGEFTNEDLLEKIFSSFCIGK
jgi:tRNA modification GTPase